MIEAKRHILAEMILWIDGKKLMACFGIREDEKWTVDLIRRKFKALGRMGPRTVLKHKVPEWGETLWDGTDELEKKIIDFDFSDCECPLCQKRKNEGITRKRKREN